jgi:hypothetical protein
MFEEKLVFLKKPLFALHRKAGSYILRFKGAVFSSQDKAIEK